MCVVDKYLQELNLILNSFFEKKNSKRENVRITYYIFFFSIENAKKWYKII